MNNPNIHIEDFLEYYYSFDKEPGYAVLLKGNWGVGKTWFIKSTLKSLESKDGKYLYVSLYGISSFEEIENEFFKQLHPLLSSKSLALTGKIAKGLLKATLKVDLDGDDKSDGSVSAQLPNIELPEYLTNTNDFVLIFDDVERSSIGIEKLLGYINHFVEHQGYKVVLLANEKEIYTQEENKKSDSYRRIKEKLIGKTYEVSPDLKKALQYFVSEITNENVQKLYSQNTNLIYEYYETSEYKNLRHLKQALWDFERLFNCFSENVKAQSELLTHLLKLYLVFSFEIKSGNILPTDIMSMRSSFYGDLFAEEQKDKPPTVSEKIRTKYKDINTYDLLIEESTWTEIFDKGIINAADIDSSLLKSQYFDSEETESWIKLWHFYEITDNEFDKSLKDVTSKFYTMEYRKLGIIKHITGLLLWLSEIKMYDKSKQEILKFARDYIDKLKDGNNLEPKSKDTFREHNSWGGLGFLSEETEDFRGFCTYIDNKKDDALIESYPKAAKELIDLLFSDIELFYRRITLCNSKDQIYYNIPIFKYVDEDEFIDNFLKIETKSKKLVCSGFTDRYKYKDFSKVLQPELEWLKNITNKLEDKKKALEGKISGYQLGIMIEQSFKKAIEDLND
jgi:hypothetical protein